MKRYYRVGMTVEALLQKTYEEYRRMHAVPSVQDYAFQLHSFPKLKGDRKEIAEKFWNKKRDEFLAKKREAVTITRTAVRNKYIGEPSLDALIRKFQERLETALIGEHYCPHEPEGGLVKQEGFGGAFASL